MMPRLRPLQLAFFALLALALGSAFWQHAHLPARVATHFDGAGHANGWLDRGTHTTLQIATLLFMTALFQGLAALNRRLPKELINVPHRDYWFAPERAAASHAFFSTTMHQLGCAVLIFFNFLFWQIYRANQLTTPRLDATIWWATAVLLSVVAIVLVRLVVRFSRRSTAPAV